MELFQKILRSSHARMMIAGWFSVSISYAVFLFLIYFGVHYQLASVANFFTYLVINFILNRKWAFRSSGSIKKEATGHFLLHLGNQLMIMAGLHVLIEWADVGAAWSQLIMQMLATVTVFLLTPIIFKSKR